MMEKPPAVLVVGAGVVGLACAFRIAREGRRVILVDRDAPGRGTSFGHAGHVATEQVFPLASPKVVRGALLYLLDRNSPLRIRPGYALRILPWLLRFAWASRRAGFERGVAAISALQKTARHDLAELLAMAGAPQLMHMDGHLMLLEQAGAMADARAEVALMGEHGIHADWLAPAEAKAMVPEIAVSLQGAWHFSGTGHVDDPYSVCKAFEDALRAAGGEVVQANIASIESRDGRFTARASDGRSFDATHVVLSCGAWSKPLAAQLGYTVPLDTERGYHITLPAAFPAFRVPVYSFERKVIMTPMTSGLRMTGTVEFGGLHLAPDPNRFALLERHLEALAPSLPTQGMTTWMGFRPSLPDHLPVLGRVPDGRNLFFAFGHQHLGLTLAGVTARLIASAVAGRDTEINLAPYSPARF
jgi:D-amino-acid dehydrogenase